MAGYREGTKEWFQAAANRIWDLLALTESDYISDEEREKSKAEAKYIVQELMAYFAEHPEKKEEAKSWA